MKKCIFVVPTYRNHFNFSYKLQESFANFDLNSDLLFVFTDEQESEEFVSKNSKKYFLPNGFTRGVDHRGIITIKKLKGVEYSMLQGYEYAIVMDCETAFTKKYNSYNASKILSENKKVYSTTTNHHVLIDISRSAADFFSNEEKQKLSIITKNFTEYFWFNNIAFYDLKVCSKFFNHVYRNDSIKNFYSKMSSAHFDHIIYIFYCLLYEDYKIVNLNEVLDIPINPFSGFHLGALESIGDRSTRERIPANLAEKIIDYLNPFWTPYGTNLKGSNSFMLFHQDRA